MGLVVKFSDGTQFRISEESKEVMYRHIRSTWGVNPDSQVVVENDRVYITSKLGEKFAQIGIIE